MLIKFHYLDTRKILTGSPDMSEYFLAGLKLGGALIELSKNAKFSSSFECFPNSYSIRTEDTYSGRNPRAKAALFPVLSPASMISKSFFYPSY